MVHINQLGSSSLSIIGIISSTICLISILFYFLIVPSKYRNELNLVLCYITIADLISSLGLIFGFAHDKTNICWSQGLLTNIGPLSSIFWTLRISIIVLEIIYQKSNSYQKLIIKTPYYWHIFGWIWPIALSLLVLTTNRYGCGGNEGLCWCFIAKRSDSPKWSQPFWTIIAFYFWVWSSILIFTIVFIISLKYCHQFQVKSCKNYAASVVVRTLVPYPFIIIFCWLYPTIFDITVAFYPESFLVNSRTSLLLASLFPSVQGAITGLVFLQFLFQELRSQFIVTPSDESHDDESNHHAFPHNLNIIDIRSNYKNDFEEQQGGEGGGGAHIDGYPPFPCHMISKSILNEMTPKSVPEEVNSFNLVDNNYNNNENNND